MTSRMIGRMAIQSLLMRANATRDVLERGLCRPASPTGFHGRSVFGLKRTKPGAMPLTVMPQSRLPE